MRAHTLRVSTAVGLQRIVTKQHDSNQMSHILVCTPSALWAFMRAVKQSHKCLLLFKSVVLDECDLLLNANHGSHVRSIVKMISQINAASGVAIHKHRRNRTHFLCVGATMSSRGATSTMSLLQRMFLGDNSKLAAVQYARLIRVVRTQRLHRIDDAVNHQFLRVKEKENEQDDKLVAEQCKAMTDRVDEHEIEDKQDMQDEFEARESDEENEDDHKSDSETKSKVTNADRAASDAHRFDLFCSIINASETESKHRRIVVYVNKVAMADRLLIMCQSAQSEGRLDVDCVFRVFHKNVRNEQRLLVLDEFNSANTEKRQVLISTNLSARGVDFRHVTQVVHYQAAQNGIDYVHRTGRMNRLSVASGHSDTQLQPEASSVTLYTSENVMLLNVLRKGLEAGRMHRRQQMKELMNPLIMHDEEEQLDRLALEDRVNDARDAEQIDALTAPYASADNQVAIQSSLAIARSSDSIDPPAPLTAHDAMSTLTVPGSLEFSFSRNRSLRNQQRKIINAQSTSFHDRLSQGKRHQSPEWKQRIERAKEIDARHQAKARGIKRRY